VTREILAPARVHGRILLHDSGATEGSLRLLVGFHGYAQNADEILAELRSIPGHEGWTLVAVQALNRFYRGRTKVTVANWMTRQDRARQIADNVAYVDTAVDAAAAGRPVSALVYCGFSQGVAMAFRAALLGRRQADAVLALGGDVPPELLADPSLRFPRVVLSAGTRDEFYTPARLAADAAALSSRSVQVETVAFDAGHVWDDAFRRRAAALLRTIR